MKFVVLCCAFCKIRRNLSFFCSINHLGPLRKHTFTCTNSKGPGLCFVIAGFWSVLLISCFKVRCLWAIIIINNNLLCRLFWSFLFLSLARIKQCLPPSFGKNPLFIPISFPILKQSRVILSKVGWAHYIVIALTPPSLKWLTEQKNPKSFRSLQYAQHNAVKFVNFFPTRDLAADCTIGMSEIVSCLQNMS